jgi:hypothetical protein
MKTFITSFITLFVISSLSHAGMFFNKPKEPSDAFDGVYTFSHICFNKKTGKQYSGDYYDGSKFVISEGKVSNNKGGAGRYIIEIDSRIDKNGTVYIYGERRDRYFMSYGKFKKDFDNQPTSLKGRVNKKKYGRNQLHKGDPCELILTRVGDFKGSQAIDKTALNEIKFESKNTIEEIALLKSEGTKIDVKAQVRNIDKIENGIIIVVPSSTPNMSDELIYEEKIKDLNYASSIIYGADPRFSSKFGANYTSSMIMYDVIAFLNELEKKYAKPKDIILMGSSTGSLAIFKAGWQKYRDTFSVMENISKVFMINAACPDTFEGELNKDIMIYAINGKDDDSTPGWVCNNLKKSKNYSNIILLSYDGAHHFESDHYGKTKFEAKGKHILPTCSINYKKNLHSVVKVRNSNKQRDAEEKGFNKEHRKWIYNNCLKEGNYQGYDEKGAADFWKDVRSIIKNKAQPQDLIGFTN